VTAEGSGVRRQVVLQGGPLDGHLHEVDERQHVVYVIHRGAQERSKGPALVLAYKRTNGDAPKWIYAGSTDAP
jgi:hypothetical protein